LIQLQTERLRLRELTEDDAEFVVRLVTEPSFMRHIGDKGVRTLEDARRFIRDGPWTNQSRTGHAQLVVELRSDGARVGVCGLLYREALDVSDVGFAILPEHRRRGYALEAATAVIEHGRTALGLDRIVGLTTPDNVASIALLETLGLRFEATVSMAPDDPGTALYS
jgi:RimJ/RimL family protein N-acetyltransferase